MQFSLDPIMVACLLLLLFLMSMVVTSVAYTLATAAWGAVQGAYLGVGSVRHWAHIRAGFHKLQDLMRAKMVRT